MIPRSPTGQPQFRRDRGAWIVLTIGAAVGGLALAAARPAGLTGPVPALRISPEWSFARGWGIVAWDTDPVARRAVFIRGTEPISDPHPRWQAQDVFVWEEGAGEPAPVYGPEAGDEAAVSHMPPALSVEPLQVVFGTVRLAPVTGTPEGHDVRRWRGTRPVAVAFGSDTGADLNFPAVDATGDIVAAAEFLPELDEPFRSRVVRWTPGNGRTILVEHERRQIMGLDQSADGTVIVYALQDFTADPPRGEIRSVTPDGTDQMVAQFGGLGGGVAVSDDGATIVAFLSEPPEGAPSTVVSPAIWRFRGRAAPERLNPTGGRVPSSGDHLTLSADGETVAWGNILWTSAGGARRLLQDDLGPVDRPRVASAVQDWTAWLPDGPDGAGLYRMPISFATPTATPPPTSTPEPGLPAYLPALRQGD